MAANNLFDQINIRGYVEGWAKITIELWRKELKKKGIGITDELDKSFTQEVQRRGADIAGIMLKFKMYGRFRDMNVGRGLKAFERAMNQSNKSAAKSVGANVDFVFRTQKRWINKIKTAQTYRLSELLGTKASQAVISNFNNTNNITVHING